MTRIALMTDSTCGLAPETLARHNIIVAPIQVMIGERVFREGVDLTAEELFQELFSSQEVASTSLPTGEDFDAAFQQARQMGAEQVLGIFLAGELSGTFNGARLAAMDHDDLTVELVDSGTTSLALGLIVLRAARRLADGENLAQVAAQARQESQRVDAFALLDTLEFVRRGGRIGRAGELIANVLNIKPVLRVADNRADVVARVRSFKKGIAWLKERATDAAPVAGLGVIHTSGESRKTAEALAQELRPLVAEGGDLLVEPASSAIAVHTGPDAIGLMLLRTE